MASEDIENPVYVVLDVETTGLNLTDEDRVIQIACLKIDKKGAKTKWISYVNPCLASEQQQEAYRIHKISADFLLTKPTFKEIAKSFLEFLSDVEFIVAHNCLFDWSILWKEFRLLQDEHYKPADEFLEKFKWFDVLRLVILHIPNQSSYKLDTLKWNLNINPEALASELLEGGGRDEWNQRPHDAMYDAITTYEVLLHCMREMTFFELVQKYPKAMLDTRLFSDMQHLLEDKRTSSADLLPFANSAKEYFTTARPKGKTLKTLSKDFLLRMTGYHRDDRRTDRRIVLIYKAAYLDLPCHTQGVNSVATPAEDSPKKHVDASAENGTKTNDKNTRESMDEGVTPSKEVSLVDNEEKASTKGKVESKEEEKCENPSHSIQKEDSMKAKDGEDNK